jgi:NAD(P)-dependent dehydrogenase (short-subunit alcohol dehydrogenase family)
MDLGLEGQLVLVVGGTGLIGAEVAQTLVREGATVVIAARDKARLDDVSARLGVRAHVVDTGDDESVGRLVDAVLGEFGHIDALVVTAAPSARTLDRSLDRDPRQVLAAMDTKAIGFLRMAEAVAPHLVATGHGRIVGISGQNALLTTNMTGAVRNATLVTIGKVLADAYAGTGVGVNVVNPGVVRVDASRDAPEHGRFGQATPAQVASLVTYLASPASDGISGESIAVGHKVMGIA